MLKTAFCIIFLHSIHMNLATPTCGPNQELVMWDSPCPPPTCEHLHPPCHIDSKIIPELKCICKRGFAPLSLSNNTCIESHACPRTCSKPNSVWKSCGTRCPPTCQYNTENQPCVKICEWGCFCEKGFLLNEENDECVRGEFCPKI